MKHKGFNTEISIGKQQFRFIENDSEYVVGIVKTGYVLIQFTDGVEVDRHTKMHLDKLNKLMPDNFQLSKDQIIYILTADHDTD
jgi:hypothetical protein